jgi:hypothetical protein
MTNEETSDEPSRWRADAAAYDEWFDQPWGSYASSIEHDLLVDAIGPVVGLEVCDAGCGTGRFAARLEAAGARVVGVDSEGASLAIARTRVTGELVEGDVHRLPFDDAHFQVTVAVTVDVPDTAGLDPHLGVPGYTTGVVVGFGAERGYPFEDFFVDTESVGLCSDLSFSTWDMRRFEPASTFLVAVLTVAERAT